jgi:abnormal spindle-like microcephaly-associated protein
MMRRVAVAAATAGGVTTIAFAENKKTTNYIAVYLDAESSKRLRSEFNLKGANEQCDHVTLKFNPSSEVMSAFEPLFGTHAIIDVLAYAEDEHCQAIYVDVRASSTGGRIQTFNNYPHVTLSCEGQTGDLYAPMYSNVLFERLAGRQIFVKGQKVFRSEWKGQLPRFEENNLDYPATEARMRGSSLKLTGMVCCEDQYDRAEEDCKVIEQEAAPSEEASSEEGTSEEGTEGEPEKAECGFCLFMRAGPCGDQFKAWEKCLEKCKEEGTLCVGPYMCWVPTLRVVDCAFPSYSYHP